MGSSRTISSCYPATPQTPIVYEGPHKKIPVLLSAPFPLEGIPISIAAARLSQIGIPVGKKRRLGLRRKMGHPAIAADEAQIVIEKRFSVNF